MWDMCTYRAHVSQSTGYMYAYLTVQWYMYMYPTVRGTRVHTSYCVPHSVVHVPHTVEYMYHLHVHWDTHTLYCGIHVPSTVIHVLCIVGYTYPVLWDTCMRHMHPTV